MTEKQKFTSKYFRKLTDSRLIQSLDLTDEDYENLGRVLAIGSHVQITSMSPSHIEIQVGFEYTSTKTFEAYLASKGLENLEAKESPTGKVSAFLGKLKLYSAGIPF